MTDEFDDTEGDSIEKTWEGSEPINLGAGWDDVHNMSVNSWDAWQRGERPDSIWREMSREDIIDIILSTQSLNNTQREQILSASKDELVRGTIGTAEHHWERVWYEEHQRFLYPKEWFSKFDYSKFRTQMNDESLEKEGQGWAKDQWGNDLGMSVNAMNAINDGELPIDQWESMSYSKKQDHIARYVSGSAFELPEAEMDALMIRTVPHHIMRDGRVEYPMFVKFDEDEYSRRYGDIAERRTSMPNTLIVYLDSVGNVTLDLSQDADGYGGNFDYAGKWYRANILLNTPWSKYTASIYRNEGGQNSTELGKVSISNVEDGINKLIGIWDSVSKSKCSCGCNDGRIYKAGTKQYLKTFSDEAWFKYLSKDSFGFLRHNADEILEVLTVGRDVADYFKTSSIQQVKEIYIGIIETIQQHSWSVAQVREAVKRANPSLTDYQVSRIVQTELGRILMYAREQQAIRNQRADARYEWTGPLDDRTTPMCRFMQTGELRGNYRYMGGTYDLESIRDMLPEWRKDGWLLPELKEVLRDTWAVFNSIGLIRTPMVGEWIIHINCRHSFQVVSQLLIEEGLIEEYEMPDMIDQYVPDSDNLLTTMMTISGYDTIPISAVTGINEGVAFVSSNGFKPIVYAPTSEYESPVTFVFRSINERQATEWAKLVLQLRDSDVDDVSIVWLLQDESNMTDEEIDYVFAHAQILYDMGENLGWVE